MVACRHDVPNLAALARLQLPEMPALHDEEGWRTHYRFGPGFHARDNYLVVARFAGTDGVLGFVWADAAPFQDYQIAEPWWCINAVAVAPEVAGKGFGRVLVSAMAEQAEAAGVASLYGTTYPQSAGFWRRQGFDVAEEGEGLQADRPIRLLDGSRHPFTMSGEAGNHLFVRSLAPPNEPNAARLERAGSPSA
jgi:GNAT superfamily N-acetyltransferase